ncbi:type I-E CRISPR-associated protein Cas7/Cse4/CasC [Streptomyces lydicus]|uniref:type I-E CRISPR-associated protein Cas7/Cse4/CasC n=1 Tax=Streptomyces lydicus TaxID=47763 RepID=UPI0036E39510
MNRYLCLHGLTTHTAVLLVRDANGRPKELPFGNAVRTLLSAQTERRADRTYLREQANLGQGPLAQYAFGMRTREWAPLTARELVKWQWDEHAALSMAKEALAGLGLNFGTKINNHHLTKVLIFAPEDTATEAATILEQHKAEMQQWVTRVTEERDKAARNAKRSKNRKKSPEEEGAEEADEKVDIPPLPTAVKQKLLSAFAPRDALDIALYGRFLAEIAESPNVDGAIQTMGSFTVGPASTVDDFYSSADDAKLTRRRERALNVFDDPGAGMTGYQSLCSGTFYSHSVVDRVKLRRTLAASTGWDAQEVEAAANAAEAAFIDAFCNAVPAAKANTTAASGTLPNLLLAFSSNRPHNYASCFEKAIETAPGGPAASLQAVRRLLAQHHMIIRKCGIEPGRVLSYDLDTEAVLDELRLTGDLSCQVTDTLDEFINPTPLSSPSATDAKRTEVAV